ncbi:DUF885 domain-containing protein [Ruania alba]|uniref:Uncharacterized conserved protein, DUF885 familyt n=1 Tax=Ruania alba TaxID=648782 RepID=A0A1H5N840_9MICO|nr:DUF885 domain-containing protein [Ruania alba]SEE97723.1 Uncharacterized conserved protein, DUF885 familyt [Ruania alba]
MTGTPGSRPRTATDAVADDYVRTLTELSPMFATEVGLPGREDALDDHSPDGLAALTQAAYDTLRALDAVTPADEVDRVTQHAMRERLGLEIELAEADEHLADLNVIASPVQSIREIFDLMPTDTPEAWRTIAARMQAVPGAVAGYIDSLRLGAARGRMAAVRQVEAGIEEAEGLAGAEGFWQSFADGARIDGHEPPPEVVAALATGAEAARAGYAALAEALRELAPLAPARDAVGPERYARFSRTFLGAEVDLDETYEWGLAELESIIAEQQVLAERLSGPGASIEQAMAELDADPARTLHGTEALREWMQSTADEAVAALAGTQFDVPDPVRTIECCIAPTESGGIYYTPPSSDFSRPGRMWWSVPPGVTEFATWREKTTVYHEGVPGHHLQIGQTVYRADALNDWRRMACWVSGHGEGWALYAERLMQDLGFLDDPADAIGMLDGQRLRAARVVIDIGVHLGKPCPPQWGGGTWDAEKAWPFLDANVNMPEGFKRFELNRYLGWPGQAPSYKVGQRLWEQLRDETRAREGAEFDLARFHRRALDVGSVGLDTLRTALLG